MKRNMEYRKILAAAYVGWWGTAVLVTLRAAHIIPQGVGSLALLTLGLGVTASLALSRLRLGNTITEVFNAGMRAAITLSANVFTDTCIMAVNRDGKIVSVDHCDAIGWDADRILGKNLMDDLLATRSGMPGRIRKLDSGTSITSPMRNQDGFVFDARLSVASLDQSVDEMRVERLVVTVSPVVTASGQYAIRE
jgi:hypothetical protein